MNKNPLKLSLVASLLAFSGSVAIPAVRADEPSATVNGPSLDSISKDASSGSGGVQKKHKKKHKRKKGVHKGGKSAPTTAAPSVSGDK